MGNGITRENHNNHFPGMKIVRLIGESKAFKKFGSVFYDKKLRGCELLTQDSNRYWECWVRHLATSDHHPVGTCKMGPSTDPLAGVSPKFRVHGLRNLRVVDGSAMPEITNGNINTPILMMAERAADFVKSTWLKSARVPRSQF